MRLGAKYNYNIIELTTISVQIAVSIFSNKTRWLPASCYGFRLYETINKTNSSLIILKTPPTQNSTRKRTNENKKYIIYSFTLFPSENMLTAVFGGKTPACPRTGEKRKKTHPQHGERNADETTSQTRKTAMIRAVGTRPAAAVGGPVGRKRRACERAPPAAAIITLICLRPLARVYKTGRRDGARVARLRGTESEYMAGTRALWGWGGRPRAFGTVARVSVFEFFLAV